ncbi:hypothetical protein [Flavobacterium flavipallidum]|uniref:Secreted protein n=1 Tax=Flavobacterium flavipallidum TaxID=3139140 RepID=A0ABU9HK60_9FLAO
MKQFLLVVMMCFAMNSFAQTEFGKKFKPIAPLNNKVAPKKVTPSVSAQAPVIKAPDLLKKPEQTLPSFSKYEIGQTKSFSMEQTNEFANPGDRVMEKMTKDLNKTLVREGLKEDDRFLVKIDKNFGEIRTKSKYFVVQYRDYISIDGDLIKATINNQMIGGIMELYSSYGQFVFNLNEGFNVFEMEAFSKGSSGGNTCEFKIYDDHGVLVRSEYWDNWDKGVKGKFVIIKE